jgi:ribosomal protein L37AE/L43A
MSARKKRVVLVCPACEVYAMKALEPERARCAGCGFTLSGEMLKTLLEIKVLPEALGTHACEECEHPQMRRLPDGVYHCPACHAEVTPVEDTVVGQGEGPILAELMNIDQ